MMVTRTILCRPVLIVPIVASRELQFTPLYANTQLTRVAMTMESMLLVSSVRGRARYGKCKNCPLPIVKRNNEIGL